LVLDGADGRGAAVFEFCAGAVAESARTKVAPRKSLLIIAVTPLKKISMTN
jgi:hypothetical protein